MTKKRGSNPINDCVDRYPMKHCTINFTADQSSYSTPRRGQLSFEYRRKSRRDLIKQRNTVSNTGKVSITDFLRLFRENGAHFISSAYLASSRDTLNTSIIDGTLSTSLAADVFMLVGAQLTLLDEFLEGEDLSMTDTGDAVVADVLLSIFRVIGCKQVHYGRTLLFLQDVESCVARANDYFTMGEKTITMMRDVSERRYSHLIWDVEESEDKPLEWNLTTNLVKQEASRLVDRLNIDAVHASQNAAIHVIQAIEQSDIPREFFSRHWEEDLTSNEVAKYVVTVCGNYLSDIKDSLSSEYLYHKVVVTLVRCIICFYVKSFVLKAHRVRYANRRHKKGRARTEFFRNPKRALMRMTHDIEVFQNFFLDVSEASSTLRKIVANEFSILGQLLLECSGYAASQNGSENLEEYVIVVYKRAGADTDVTKHFLSDIFILMTGVDKDWCVRETVRHLREDLNRMKESIGERRNASPSVQATKADSAYFCLDEMLKTVYEERILQEKATLCGGIGTALGI
mmetsp:Transcript_4354/g.12529  ORF Transcript_4354/g.12529 Transcript_4354/m.12529 type:complete len:514 (+) Transcript_4354:259-1800(+)